MRNDTIKDQMKSHLKSQFGQKSSKALIEDEEAGLGEYHSKHVSSIRDLMQQTAKDKSNMKKINLGDQAKFKYGNFEQQPHVQSLSMLY